MTIQTKNPFDNKVLHSFQEMTSKEVDLAISKAHEAFESWKETSFATRSQLLHKSAEIMRTNMEYYARTITLEMGKLIAQARAEVELSADILDYYADNSERFLMDQPLKVSSGSAYIKNCPIGVIFGVEPWNFPFYQVVRVAGPNIMAGNTVLIKHASNVPQCGVNLEQIFREAGAPEGVYTNLLISAKHVSRVIENPLVSGVSLTGSEAAGASVAETAGKVLKKSVLELGGSDPFIVLDDADIDKTINSAVWAKMNNTGQCCVAAKRFIVMDSVADEFIRKFKEKLAHLEAGDPLDEKTTLGPLSSEQAAVQLEKQIGDTLKMGAKAVLGGSERKGPLLNQRFWLV